MNNISLSLKTYCLTHSLATIEIIRNGASVISHGVSLVVLYLYLVTYTGNRHVSYSADALIQSEFHLSYLYS